MPILGTIIAGTIAKLAGCPLDGSSVKPCFIGGTNHGKTLFTLLNLNWLLIVTVPAAIVAFAVLGIAQAALLLVRRRKP